MRGSADTDTVDAEMRNVQKSLKRDSRHQNSDDVNSVRRVQILQSFLVGRVGGGWRSRRGFGVRAQ